MNKSQWCRLFCPVLVSFFCVMFSFLLLEVRAEQLDEGLVGQLRRLAQAQNITITGLEFVEDEPVLASPNGDVHERFRALLIDYNYVVVGRGASKIAEIRILGRQSAHRPSTGTYSIVTTRHGMHHVVDTLVVGPNGIPWAVPLIIDTGATTIVLPSSAMDRTGFRADELKSGVATTVAGEVSVQIGRFSNVSVGSAVARDVEVSFIEDDHLHGRGLLGMSYLSRFRVTVDDGKNHLILLQK